MKLKKMLIIPCWLVVAAVVTQCLWRCINALSMQRTRTTKKEKKNVAIIFCRDKLGSFGFCLFN